MKPEGHEQTSLRSSLIRPGACSSARASRVASFPTGSRAAQQGWNMRRVLRGCRVASFVALTVIATVTLAVPVGATSIRTGVIAGRLELCIPAVPTTTLPVPTTVPGASSTTTIPFIPPDRILLTPAPSYALLLKGGVVIQREGLKVYLIPDGPIATPYDDGKFLMVARFALRAKPGPYLAEALQVRRHVVIVAGRTTRLHVLIEGC